MALIAQQVALEMITAVRPLVAEIRRRNRNLADQVERDAKVPQAIAAAALLSPGRLARARRSATIWASCESRRNR